MSVSVKAVWLLWELAELQQSAAERIKTKASPTGDKSQANNHHLPLSKVTLNVLQQCNSMKKRLSQLWSISQTRKWFSKPRTGCTGHMTSRIWRQTTGAQRWIVLMSHCLHFTQEGKIFSAVFCVMESFLDWPLLFYCNTVWLIAPWSIIMLAVL